MTVRSLYVGYSGLNAMGHQIDVIGNNIANVNTVGYKANRATFDDVFYTMMFPGQAAGASRGGINPRQIGNGVKLGSVDTIFTQGSSQSTGRLMDLSINGNGFFVLRNGAGRDFLTRAGNFSMDDQGFMVDPGTGYRLVGRSADENGILLVEQAPGELKIDLNRKSLAKPTENVRASGNFDNRVGDPDRGVDVAQAQRSTKLLGLFDNVGNPFGLINGDVIRFETGFLELGDRPDNIDGPINLATTDGGAGDGVLLKVTQDTTVEDLQRALNDYLKTVVRDIDTSRDSNISINFDNTTGTFEFNNYGENALKGIRIGVEPRGGATQPPTEANRKVGNLFVNQGDPNFTRTLDVAADSVVRTNAVRRSDASTSIDVFDSQGSSHTVTVGMAVDTSSPAAIESTLVSKLRDSEGRFMLPEGIVPAQVTYSRPILDSATNTAVFTAQQIHNMVVTQGVFTFNDGDGNLIALRLTDGALSFNGEEFNIPIQEDGSVLGELTDAGLDVTGDSFLNIPSALNPTGGLLGDDGFTESTTLEDIRRNIEDRINTSIRQVAANLQNIDANATTLNGVPDDGFAALQEIPSISVSLSPEGAIRFSAEGGSLGASVSTSEEINNELLTQVGGEENMGLVIDLAARVRSIRISTIDPGEDIADPDTNFADGKVDESFADGGGISGFIPSVNPFEGDVESIFSIGNTDFGLFDPDGNPTADPPTGVDDSGTHLVALSSGRLPVNDNLDDQRFSDFQAFAPEISMMQALFNKRGYGVAKNFDGVPGIDRTEGVPVGVIAIADAAQPFEINTLHRDGQMRNTVHYQVATPNDNRTIPTQTTGAMIFDSTGRFERYATNATTPNITFDPDDFDPENDGVNPIAFNLDLSGITFFSGPSTAQLVGQDGRPVGNLDDVSIASNGEIIGIFSNGDAQVMGKILLADVTNPGGLIQEGAAMFTHSPNSGDFYFIEADVEGGAINSGALELSNVDLAKEFTDLIVAQRAYQANSRVILTSDQILTELVNMKR